MKKLTKTQRSFIKEVNQVFNTSDWDFCGSSIDATTSYAGAEKGVKKLNKTHITLKITEQYLTKKWSEIQEYVLPNCKSHNEAIDQICIYISVDIAGILLFKFKPYVPGDVTFFLCPNSRF